MANKHNFTPALLPLGLALIGLPASAQAQTGTTDLGSVVVSAAGYEQKLVDAPASISVISAQDLHSKPYTSLLDAVRELEGVDVGETRDKTGQGTISLRGMGADYTLILIDGKRQNNHGDIYPNNFGGNQFNHIPPLDAIERIEVIRGPASTLYGADALGGVINIITKKVTDQWNGSLTMGSTLQEQSQYGNDYTADINLMGPVIKEHLGVKLRASYYNREASAPEFESITDPAGVKHDRSLGFGGGGRTVDNTNRSLGASLDWKITPTQSLSLDMDSYKQIYDNKPLADGTVPLGTVDSINSIWQASGNGASRRANPRAGYAQDQEFSRSSWALTHQGNWDFGNSFVSLNYVNTSNDGRTLPFTVAERQQLLAMIDGTGVYAGKSEAERKALAEQTFLPRKKRAMESEQYVLDAKLDIPFEMLGQHTAVLGGQVTHGTLKDGVFGMENGQPGAEQEHNMWSVFAEDTWYVLNPLAVTTGLRYDHHELFGSNLSPRMYGVYNLTPNWTLKGGVSTGFKTPKTTDLYEGVRGFGGQGTSPMYGNPDLKPEKSISNELALYWQGDTGHSANVTLFYNQFKDKISSQPCGTGTSYSCSDVGEYEDLGYSTSNKSVNIDEVLLQGIELAGRLQLLDSLQLKANYTYTDGEQKSGKDEGKPFGNLAKHMLNSTLDWQMLSNLNLFLTLEARDKRYRSWDAVEDKALYYKGYELLHLGFGYQISKNVRLSGRVNNLLDQDFTTYETVFADLDNDGSYSGSGEITFLDDYNNKDARRNYWLSLNVNF